MGDSTRIVLFWGLCIPLRFGLAFLPTVLNGAQHYYLGTMVCAMAVGTLYLAYTNSRMHAFEGGGNTWWAKFRRVHGFLLSTAAVLLYRQDRMACVPLLLDALLAIFLYLVVREG
jgi:hypothetical protein